MHMVKQIRWGFVGVGRISRHFIKGFPYAPQAVVSSVYARKFEKAKEFSEQYQIPYYYDDYDKFLEEKNFDIVYVALPHQKHEEFAAKALERGIPVLCEKPITPTSAELKRLIALSKKKNVFLMEAMWTRYFPVTKKVQEWIDSGKIGKVKALQGGFSFKGNANPNDRRYSLETAGGALLDLGVYVLSYFSMVMKSMPLETAALSKKLETGVDGMDGILCRYEDAIATAIFTFAFTTPSVMTIYGEDGYIRVDGHFWKPERAHLFIGAQEEIFEDIHPEDGYQYEIAAVSDYIAAGETDSKEIPLAESLAIIEWTEEIRKKWGLQYPFE
ncbi:dehydrogenase [Bacteroidia bacterium]|nr:dehydrogenase [Bacteroidia bacterium]